ncbi:DNA replication and repair protein RecF [Tessaracoccus sp. O5.2]|uniref:ATP-dependent nuclease n=1 Tax=Tessaracoccus sp. O5.2 TaxID=3157622 RepID=UPI0035E63550
MIERIVIRGYRVFKELDLKLNSKMNIIVGRNESGKSTLLEAINMALTGRIHGQWLADQLNPYWFNQETTRSYLLGRRNGRQMSAPEIVIDVYLASDDPDIQRLRGINNWDQTDSPGLRVAVTLDPDYVDEFEEYVADVDTPLLLPTEFFKVEWKSFQGSALGRRPRKLGVAQIDSRTLHSTSGVDYHTRKLLVDHIEDRESARLSAALRKARHNITETHLSAANDRIKAEAYSPDAEIGLQIDQAAGSGWQGSVVPQVGDIPFAMSGQGQQSASKVALAMSRTADSTSVVLVEEPENHLAHTRLMHLMGRLEDLAAGRQMIVTTHSSYVLNRLGLGDLILLSEGGATRITDVSNDTVRYFKKLSGYDTLRVVLADKLALVEGPADEMVLARAYEDASGRLPHEDKIDIVSLRGTAFKRSLELSHALGRQVIFLRDNDKKAIEDWNAHYGELLDGKRRMYVGDPTLGKTLEPQVVAANAQQLEVLRAALCLGENDDPEEWILKDSNKTEAALRILESSVKIAFPPYINEAVEDLQGDW